MQPANRIRLFLLSALALLSIGTASAASLATPEQSGLLQVAENIYVSPEMPRAQVEQALSLVHQARQRVAQFYGDLRARPNIVLCATTECYCEFGAVGLGFTDGSHLVIAPQGLRVPIIVHELAHVEFASRVGSFAKVLHDVPQWFDEGQAVLISQAEEFSEAAWREATGDGRNAPPLAALTAMDDWNRLTGANGEYMHFTYGTARHEVGHWFAVAGPSGLRALAEAMHQGATFADAYGQTGADRRLATALPDRQAPAMSGPALPGAALGGLVRAAW
jgi:hypothetical protein